MPEKCDRCRRQDEIPTYQFLKFDGEVQFLCRDCWEMFRRWFFSSRRIERDTGSEDSPPTP